MEIKLNSEYITLTQLLKITDYISSGGEAKILLAELDIRVNGEEERRRGKKLYPNDNIVIEGNDYTLI